MKFLVKPDFDIVLVIQNVLFYLFDRARILGQVNGRRSLKSGWSSNSIGREDKSILLILILAVRNNYIIYNCKYNNRNYFTFFY